MSGSHSSSDDSNDSRKRPPEETLCPDTSPKRANCDDVVHLKILIPCIAAGAVIGKSGEAIGKIQKETNTKVKISKQDEFYPGTTERVCLIIGSIDGVMCVNNYIMDRILEKPDPNPHATCEGRLNVERHKQVKILVPNSTAGMVIGKGGSYIQEIKDKTGAYVQISQKSREFNLLERCIIIAGDLDQTRAAVQLILAVIAADPQSASCPNLSYHDIRGPVASVYPTGSPYATPVVPCPINPGWLAPSSSPVVDTATMMAAAAMLSPRSLTPVQNPATFNPFLSSTSYPAQTPDLSSLTSALTASNPVLGGLLQPATQLPGSPGSTEAAGASTSALPTQVSFTLDPNQPGAMLDPSMTVAAAAAQQAALLAASIRSKTQVLGSEMQQLTDSSVLPSAMSPQNSVVPASGLITYAPGALQLHSIQPSAEDFQLGQAISCPSVVISSSSSLNTAVNLTIAAAAAAAATSTPGVGTTPAAANLIDASSTVSNPSVFFPSLSDESYSLACSYTGTGGSPQSPMLGLYALQNTGSPTLSNLSNYLCRRMIPVPENMIGLILGPQGRSVVDLQAVSGTTIQISQKGVYSPGTHNRMVVITGPALNVQWIANLIEQRVSAEQLRRESMSSSQSGSSPMLSAPESTDNPQLRRQTLFFNFPVGTTVPGSVYSTTTVLLSPSSPTSTTSAQPQPVTTTTDAAKSMVLGPSTSSSETGPPGPSSSNRPSL